MPAKLNLSGLQFGSLLVINENGRDTWGAVLWRCSCECGKTTLARGTHLTQGKTKSCGCGIGAAAIKRWTTHGGSKTELFKRWQSMKARCNNPNAEEYHNYGGRGIRVCDRWKKFENFKADMGKTFMSELEIDRKDNNGNYEPGNCRWVNRTVQQRNRRNNHVLTVGGITKTLAEWSEETGVKANTILTRIRRGWNKSRLLELANQ